MPPSSPNTHRITGPFDLSKTPIHLDGRADPEASAIPLREFTFDAESFERYIAQHCRPGAPGRLVMIESTPTDWSAWECHTEGDEVVIVLEGKAVFVQEIEGESRRTAVGPGSTLINPANVWHTADVEEPLKAIYITPCPGTQHRPR